MGISLPASHLSRDISSHAFKDRRQRVDTMDFLIMEDERGLLQATIPRFVYERRGDLWHYEGTFLL